MGKAEVLERVAADLARGHTHLVIQRLGSLVAANPDDVDLRRRLAEVYRDVGNRIEAGRWSYLHPDADPDDIRAFERAYPTAAQRLRRLRRSATPAGPAAEPPDAHTYARARLDRLADEARREVVTRPSRPVMATPWSYTIIVAAAAMVAAVFVVVGAWTVLRWLG